MKWYRQLAWQSNNNNNVADGFQLKFRVESIAARYKVTNRLLLQRYPIAMCRFESFFSRCINVFPFLNRATWCTGTKDVSTTWNCRSPREHATTLVTYQVSIVSHHEPNVSSRSTNSRPCLPSSWTGDPRLLIEIQTSIVWRTLGPLRPLRSLSRHRRFEGPDFSRFPGRNYRVTTAGR